MPTNNETAASMQNKKVNPYGAFPLEVKTSDTEAANMQRGAQEQAANMQRGAQEQAANMQRGAQEQAANMQNKKVNPYGAYLLVNEAATARKFYNMGMTENELQMLLQVFSVLKGSKLEGKWIYAGNPLDNNYPTTATGRETGAQVPKIFQQWAHYVIDKGSKYAGKGDISTFTQYCINCANAANRANYAGEHISWKFVENRLPVVTTVFSEDGEESKLKKYAKKGDKERNKTLDNYLSQLSNNKSLANPKDTCAAFNNLLQFYSQSTDTPLIHPEDASLLDKIQATIHNYVDQDPAYTQQFFHEAMSQPYVKQWLISNGFTEKMIQQIGQYKDDTNTKEAIAQAKANAMAYYENEANNRE